MTNAPKIDKERWGHTGCHCRKHNASSNQPSTTYEVSEIDVNSLAWLNFESNTDRARCRQLLRIAARLMPPGAWAIVQTESVLDPVWIKEEGFQIVETFDNEAPAGISLSLYLTRRNI